MYYYVVKFVKFQTNVKFIDIYITIYSMDIPWIQHTYFNEAAHCGKTGEGEAVYNTPGSRMQNAEEGLVQAAWTKREGERLEEERRGHWRAPMQGRGVMRGEFVYTV